MGLGEAATMMGGCCGLVVCVGLGIGGWLWAVQSSIGRQIADAQDRVTRQ